MMLLAYAISGDTTLTAGLVAELRSVATHLAEENLPAGLDLGFRFDGLVAGPVEGTVLRGFQHVADRTSALYVIQCLRRLSQRFPQFSFYVSGAGELPMTQIEGGSFTLFADTYERALATFSATQLQAPQRRRVNN